MFRRPTAIILGAGASAECNLPAGDDLKRRIAEGLNFNFDRGTGDDAILDGLRRQYPDAAERKERIAKFVEAGRELSKTITTFPSIDEALYWWRARDEIVTLGKLAIARYILEAEKSSTLARRAGLPGIDVDDASGCWLRIFLSICLAGADREDVLAAFDNVTFINFNYDRTVEQYVYWALQQRAGVDSKTAAQTVAKLKIIRPYGSIGRLDWLGGHQVEFGNDSNVDIVSVSRSIRTFTEQSEGNDVFQRIDDALEQSRLVMFLGFGFHQQNLQMLRPGAGKTRGNSRVILATSLGIDAKNYDAMRNRLESQFALRNCQLISTTASQLLESMRPAITIAAS